MKQPERRIVPARRMELREVTPGVKQLVGYGAVFDTETVIAGFFRERIAPGAFDAVVKNDDVRGLFNHDPNYVLGRTAAGTMRLAVDEVGLGYEIDLNPDDPDAVRTAAKVSRGDVTGSSFTFTVKRDEWTRPSSPAELPLRTILEVEHLYDTGPVTFPAYEETTSEARDAAAALRSGVTALIPEAAGPRSGAIDIRERELQLAEASL